MFNLEDIFDRLIKCDELFFSILELFSLDKKSYFRIKTISRSAIALSLIFKNLRSIIYLSYGSNELYKGNVLASLLGFKPRDKPIPIERDFLSLSYKILTISLYKFQEYYW